MNRDDTGELWVQALKETWASEIIYKFAELVAAAEREACALECEKHFEYYGFDHVFAAAIRNRGQE